MEEAPEMGEVVTHSWYQSQAVIRGTALQWEVGVRGRW